MGLALYRKHRSKSLDEIVGQEHITDTLKLAIKKGRISHAYLFTGPRGVGKTSIARILAHEINQLPYSNESAHIDIIEIDAASNRRIDEIRELRDRVYVAPSSAKYKVYIIDEVHMLTREAFNALLKTLEEPPAHVVFILATTDAHKLPATIISRTQRFTFKPVQKSKVIGHLQSIAKAEGIEIDNDALGLLAEHGEGSFRDSISLLDQASSHGKRLGLADIQQLLGLPSDQAVQQLAAQVGTAQDAAFVISLLESMYDQGYQAATIAKQLGKMLRHQLSQNELLVDRQTALGLMDKLIQVPVSHDPERALEVILLGSLLTPSMPVSSPSGAEIPKTELAETEPRQKPADKKPKSADSSQLELGDASWPAILASLKLKHNTLYGVVRMAEPSFEQEGVVKLSFAFAFHQKRSNENSNREKLAAIIHEVTGQTVKVESIHRADSKPPKPVVAAIKSAPSKNLSTISNIFGEAELLES